MTVTIIRRLMQSLIVVVAMSLIVFVGVSSLGDPTYMAPEYIEDFRFEHFTLEGYECHPHIKAKDSV